MHFEITRIDKRVDIYDGMLAHLLALLNLKMTLEKIVSLIPFRQLQIRSLSSNDGYGRENVT